MKNYILIGLSLLILTGCTPVDVMLTPDFPGSSSAADETPVATDTQAFTLTPDPNQTLFPPTTGLTTETLTQVELPSPTDAPTSIPTITLNSTSTVASIGTYQDFEPNNGTALGEYCKEEWLATCSITTNQIYEGQGAVIVDAFGQAEGEGDDTGGTVKIFPAAGSAVNLSSGSEFSIWVLDTCGNNDVALKLIDSDRAEALVWSGDVGDNLFSTKDQWTEIVWPLSAFTGIDKSRIVEIEIYEHHDCIYYFDYITWR